MIDYSRAEHKYTYLWKKYRPAILNLMVASADGPQEYKFLKHEFQDAHSKQKGGYSFTLQVFQNKAVNKIKDSLMALDLLTILQQSGKAAELTETSVYEFILDKQFVLHIKKIETEEEEPIETEDSLADTEKS